MTIRLRHLAAINPPVPGWEQISDDSLLTFVPLEAVWPGRVDFTRKRPKSETSTGYTRFMEGDLIVPKITPTFEADRSTRIEGSPTTVLTGTTELHVVRPSVKLDPRYLDYLFSSRPFLEGGASEMIGVAGQKRIPDEWLRNFRVPVDSVQQQGDIADFLDNETVRIDTLISKKRRLVSLLDDREQSLRDEWFSGLSSTYGLIAVRRLTDHIEQGWSPNCDSAPAEKDEWGVIKTSAVSSGRFLAEENKKLPHATEPEIRWKLRDGDLLIIRGSGSRKMVGRACVAQIGDRKLTLSDLIYRVQLTQADSEYVASAMLSSQVRTQIESSIRTDTGMTLKIRGDDLADIRIPAVPQDVQSLETVGLAEGLLQLHNCKQVIEKQLLLLVERRLALVTGTVTGELDISVV